MPNQADTHPCRLFKNMNYNHGVYNGEAGMLVDVFHAVSNFQLRKFGFRLDFISY